MTYLYRSPYRPLEIAWAKSAAEEENLPFDIDWDNTNIGEWTPKTVYAFHFPLSERFVKQWDLEVLE